MPICSSIKHLVTAFELIFSSRAAVALIPLHMSYTRAWLAVVREDSLDLCGTHIDTYDLNYVIDEGEANPQVKVASRCNGQEPDVPTDGRVEVHAIW